MVTDWWPAYRLINQSGQCTEVDNTNLHLREAPMITDQTAATARTMKVIEAIIEEFDRQGVADFLSERAFDVTALAKATLRAADGDVIPFRRG
jgi:ABC-type branched-subunit amino acid transport system substrate-binding protein